MPSIYAATDPAAYERSMGRWSRRLAGPFLDFAAIGGAVEVLDVGCGTGSLTFALADAAPGARIVGIDHSQAYVDHARSRAPDGGRLKFEQGDAAALPYGDQAFDAALSLLVLNFVPDAERAAGELARATRPGGVVAACVWDFRGGLTFLRVLADTVAALDPGGEAFRARQFSAPFTGPGELKAGGVDKNGLGRGRADGAHHPHGVPVLRRLLGALAGRAGHGRSLRDEPERSEAAARRAPSAARLSGGR